MEGLMIGSTLYGVEGEEEEEEKGEGEGEQLR